MDSKLNIYALVLASASSNAAIIRVRSCATKDLVVLAEKPSSRRSAAIVDAQFYSLHCHAVLGLRHAASNAKGLEIAAIPKSHTTVMEMRRHAQNAHFSLPSRVSAPRIN
jgi:hypothetical protein